MYDRISEYWQLAQNGAITWHKVRHRLGIYLETAAIMRDYTLISDLFLLIGITIRLQEMQYWRKMEARKRFVVVK